MAHGKCNNTTSTIHIPMLPPAYNLHDYQGRGSCRHENTAIQIDICITFEFKQHQVTYFPVVSFRN